MKTSEFFDTEAQAWDELYEQDPRFQRRFERITKFLEQVLPQNPSHALDAGCGSGIFSRYLASRGWQVTAFDVSSEMIDSAKELSSNLPIGYQQSSIESFDLPDASFDAIVSFSMLEYVEDDEAVVQKFARLLKPGGVLVLSVPNRSGWLRKIEGMIFGVRSVTRDRMFSGRGEYLKFQKQQYSPFELDLMLRQHGLRKKRAIYLNAGIAGPNWLLPMLERRWWAAMYCVAYEKKK